MGDHPKPEMGTEKDVVLQRIVAYIIDMVIVGIVGIALSFTGLIFGSVVGRISAGVGVTTIILFGFLSLAFMLFYAFLLEGYWGQTLGKKIMGIVVVKEDGSPCTYEASIVRNLLRIIDTLPQLYIAGFIVIALTDKRQRIGDRLANTIVVETKE